MPDSLAVRLVKNSQLEPTPSPGSGAASLARVSQVLDTFAARDFNGEVLTAVRHYPAREAQWAEFPEWIEADLRAAYEAKGIRRLYSHQAAAVEAVHAGKNVVIVTPTASGKTLCYNLPILNAILGDADTRALYLFPTKALAQDQLAELYDLNQRLDACLDERSEKNRSKDRPLQTQELQPQEPQTQERPTPQPYPGRNDRASEGRALHETRGCLINGGGAKRRVSSGAKAQFLPGLNVGAEAPTPIATIYEMASSRFGVFTYDGDTPSDARKSIREKSHIVLTNPDMLHAGILPHHTRWTRLFENLRYIVVDELHNYRGVFGSHLCNVLRRLRRIAKFYGREPQFICCSATIANPGELASRLIEDDVEVLAENGAPAAEKTFVFYNPPVVNRALGIRRSYINEASRVSQEFLKHDLQTMVFANSRLHTEIILTYLQQANPQLPGKPETIRGYRGGYLPNERREIERGLREGRIRGVVSTSAMELGIDVGSLDTVVMAGYPGTIAATWQRAGRAGRRSGRSCAVLVASSSPLDQFIVRHPDYFFGNTPEHAFIQPDNLEILINHLKCAAFELPIGPQEKFGDVDLRDLCARLAEAGYLHLAGENYHWTNEAYPADAISLRSVTSDNFVIIDITGQPLVIGEVDYPSALTTVHEKAIYLHGGQQYHVEHLDFKERKAYVKQVEVDYYTDAIRYTQVRVLEGAATSRGNEDSDTGDLADMGSSNAGPLQRDNSRSHGDVLVRSQVVGFKKIKFFTNENVGAGQLELPENEMHTTSYWITLERPLLESLPYTISERQSGMFGLLHALETVATLLLMCDARDLGTAIGERPPTPDTSEEAVVSEAKNPRANARNPWMTGEKEFFEPNLYLFDAYPGGIGFSEPLFGAHELLVHKTRELIRACPCEQGCPSCVGPAGDLAPRAKEAALAILDRLCA
jgi:DEAD/DEAH box helicase domain-containing protein